MISVKKKILRPLNRPEMNGVIHPKNGVRNVHVSRRWHVSLLFAENARSVVLYFGGRRVNRAFLACFGGYSRQRECG